MKREVYFDNAATTRPDLRVVEAMLPYLREKYGNPLSIYPLGVEARNAIEEARESVAELVGGKPKSTYFTSSGSEANNLAIKGYAFAAMDKGKHIVASAIEHQSILRTQCLPQRSCQGDIFGFTGFSIAWPVAEEPFLSKIALRFEFDGDFGCGFEFDRKPQHAGIGRHFRPGRAAQQSIDGLLVKFTFQIPQSAVDGADPGHKEPGAAVSVHAQHLIEQQFIRQWITFD